MAKPSTPPEFPEGNGDVVSKGPCPNCPTEFGNVTYADGHTHCFACGHKTKPIGKTPVAGFVNAAQQSVLSKPKAPSSLLNPADYPNAYMALAHRKLNSTTLRRFGYFTGRFKGETVEVAPYFDQQGNLACQKLRLPNKEFVVLKAGEGSASITECQLFGRPVFGDKNDLRVVVTEGEIDAMSCAQATDFKFPCVSVNGGSKGAAKSLKANYLWLDRFKEIILWFDNDEPGQQAIAECAPLFAVGKVKVAKAPTR